MFVFNFFINFILEDLSPINFLILNSEFGLEYILSYTPWPGVYEREFF